MKNTYMVTIQYESISCRHRHNITAYVRANNEDDAMDFARNLPHHEDYIVRLVKPRLIEVYEVA